MKTSDILIAAKELLESDEELYVCIAIVKMTDGVCEHMESVKELLVLRQKSYALLTKISNSLQPWSSVRTWLVNEAGVSQAEVGNYEKLKALIARGNMSSIGDHYADRNEDVAIDLYQNTTN